MITLEVKGRRSRQPRGAVLNTVEYEGERYLVSPRGESEWVRNVRAAGGEAVIRHGARRKVRLVEIGAAERAPIIKKYLKENTLSTKAHFGIEPGAPLEEFQRIAGLHPVFRIVAS
jgi:deazaflavin-dependent oxidoreductase (nitroreductase family)